MDKAEFSKRVNAAMDRLYRITCGQLREPQDRMDAIQDALFKAWTHRERLRNPEYFETWLIRILINECHNHQRRLKRVAPLEDEILEAARAPEDCQDHDGAVIREAIYALKEKYRTVILLHCVEDYSIDEVSMILKLPRETVRTRLRRAKAALRQALDETNKEDGNR